MELKEINGISVFQSDLLKGTPIIHGFTTRQMKTAAWPSFSSKPDKIGKSALGLFSSAMGLENYHLVLQEQIHGDVISIITKNQLTERITVVPGNDGLITSEPGICLFSLSADCMSLMLAHPEKHVIANAHCGRRGAIRNLPQKLAITMCREFFLLPSDLVALLGTCISMNCYEVGEDTVGELKENDPDSLAFLVKRGSKRYFDLKGYVFYQLTSLGLNPDNIDFQPLCSHCNEDLFYSFRRDGEVKGSQAGFIAVKET